MNAASVPGRLYAIVDAAAAAAAGWNVPDLARAVLRGGGRWLQLRARDGVSGGQFLDWCEEVVSLARPVGATIVVNDRVDLAAMAGADGVHLGQDDLDTVSARNILPSGALVGRSTHTPAQINEAVAESVSYVAVGPIFETSTKTTGYAPLGTGEVARAVARAQGIPVVGIGGITLETAPQVVAAGAEAVAVISDLFVGGDPERRVAKYVEALG